MKWLKRVGVVVAAMLIVLALALFWLLDTQAGLRFALARASGFTHGALSVQHAQGRLLGPLQLRGVRYADGNGMQINVGTAALELQFWPLLRKRLHVLDLQLTNVAIALPATGNAPTNSAPFSLQPPIDLVVDRAHVGKLDITRAGQPVFASNRIDLAGQWTGDGIALQQLTLQAPAGHAELDGKLVIGTAFSGDGRASFAWKVGDTNWAGTLVARSDGQRSHAQVVLSQPTAANLQLDLAQNANHDWTATLAVPTFDPTPLIGPSSLRTLALNLDGKGDRTSGTLGGRIDLNDYRVLLQPLRAHFSDGLKTLQLDRLALGSPQIKGALEATGTLQLGAQPVTGDLALRWNDLLLPADLAGQPLASRGSVQASGSAARYHVQGEVHVGPPGKLAKLALNLDGTDALIRLHTLDLKQPKGGLQAHGMVTLKPALGWQLQARADHFDPGQLIAGWNGALDADLASSGSLPANGPDARVEIRQLAGRLRGRAVHGAGTLHLSPNRVLDGNLQLASGASHIAVTGKPGERNDIHLTLAIASLGDWLPNAAGRVNGVFDVRGKSPRLSVDGTLDGQAVQYQGNRIDRVHLIAHVPDISEPGGELVLTGNDAHAGGLVFQRIELNGDGTAASHRLTLDARGLQVSGRLALNGSLKAGAWRGTLTRLDLLPQGLPAWRLSSPTSLTWRDGTTHLSELCLTAGDPLLCVAATQDKAGKLDASYRLRALPLALLLDASGQADLPVRVDGNVQGDGTFLRSAAGAWSGTASLGSPRGSVLYTDRADRPLLAWGDLAVDAVLDASGQHATVHASLDDGGRLDGRIALRGDAKALDGELAVHLNSLAPIELLTAEVVDVHGRLDGQFQFADTLAQPVITGSANVSDFAAEIPTAGLKLRHGQLRVTAVDAAHLRLQGTVQSGKGTVAIAGVYGLGAGTPTAITFNGNRFTAADIPSAHIVISPSLLLRQDANGIDVSGAVALDNAEVNLARLPGAGATHASPDVVVIDEKQQQQAAAKLPISGQVKVDLGNKTHLIGRGLDGYVSGVLTVTERPGRATLGRGQIAVSGTYKAYGQNLAIKHGQLLFASTPIDNPGLDIRAVRKLNPNATIDQGQEVGLLVSGTAKRPVLTVFSNPVMEQSDALSYLVTGKPLSQVNGGEGDLVGAAAQALGSAAGNLLAKRVGAKLGIDDIGVSSNEALGGSSAFTVGKYLSPRLYLSYGVGLFEPGQVITLRYRLSQRWNFEAQNATDFSRASFNYRYER